MISVTTHAIEALAQFYPRTGGSADVRSEVDQGVPIQREVALRLAGRGRARPDAAQSAYVLHRERTGMFVLRDADDLSTHDLPDPIDLREDVDVLVVTFLRFLSLDQFRLAVQLYGPGDPVTATSSWVGEVDPPSRKVCGLELSRFRLGNAVRKKLGIGKRESRTEDGLDAFWRLAIPVEDPEGGWVVNGPEGVTYPLGVIVIGGDHFGLLELDNAYRVYPARRGGVPQAAEDAGPTLLFQGVPVSEVTISQGVARLLGGRERARELLATLDPVSGDGTPCVRFLVEGRPVKVVQRHTDGGLRWHARSGVESPGQLPSVREVNPQHVAMALELRRAGWTVRPPVTAGAATIAQEAE